MTATAHEHVVCANHPDRETRLRCNRCGKPICASCAVQTPTGYRCEECISGQQKRFDTAEWYDYPLAIGLAAALSFLGSLLASFVGFFILLIAPAAGALIAEVIRRVVARRRSKRLFQLATAGVVLGGLLPHLPLLLLVFLGSGLGVLFSLLWPSLYVLLAASTTYYRLSGIQLSL